MVEVVMVAIMPLLPWHDTFSRFFKDHASSFNSTSVP